MLATIQTEQDEIDAAHETWEGLILKVKIYVPFQYRKNAPFVRQAEHRLKSLLLP